MCLRGSRISWTVPLLPYLDEAGTLKHIDLAAGAYAEKNAPVRKLNIAAFVCPSQVPVATVAAPASSYAGCHHDVEQPIADDNHGVLFLNSHISERNVTDGPEHTIYVGEKRVDEGDLGWMSGTGPRSATRARQSIKRQPRRKSAGEQRKRPAGRHRRVTTSAVRSRH